MTFSEAWPRRAPGIYEDVSRSEHVRVRAFDEFGNPIELEAEGYLARAIQHENDHLNGVLFTDRLSPLRRQFLKKALDIQFFPELTEVRTRIGAPP